jgi:hypothetical protein
MPYTKTYIVEAVILENIQRVTFHTVVSENAPMVLDLLEEGYIGTF